MSGGEPRRCPDGETRPSVRRFPAFRERARSLRFGRDLAATSSTAVVFSTALGASSVALPLLALDAGYSGFEIGVLTAISAISQMAARVSLGAVMRRYGDWVLVVAGQLGLAASSGLVALSAAWVPFILAELLQGAARGLNWTGSQTHVVRGAGSSVTAMATINFFSSVGLLAGPVLAGWLSDGSPAFALGVAAAVSLGGVVPALCLDRLPPFARPPGRHRGAIWRRPGVAAGAWAGVTAGAWRGLIGSYVPVALTQAAQNSRTVGALVSTANAAGIVGSVIVARVRTQRSTAPLVVGTLATGLGTALVGWFAGHVLLAAVVLALSGLGAGALQTIGPALAGDSVHREERGEAVAVTGAFRAAALFVSPLAVAGLTELLPLAGALGLAGAALGVLPVAVTWRPSGRPGKQKCRPSGESPSEGGAPP